MAGKSYEYKVICPICGITYHNYEMRRRWDGQIVCPEDWEPRNILDFYQPRNDTHKLPFILTDSGDGATSVAPNTRSSTLTFSNKLVAPAVPASGIGQANTFGRRVSVLIITTSAPTTLTKVTRDGIDLELTDMATVMLEPTQVIALTYTGTPTWIWYG